MRTEKIQKLEKAIERSQVKIEKDQHRIDQKNFAYESKKKEFNNQVLPVDEINKLHIQNGLDKSHNQYLSGWTNLLCDNGKSDVEINQTCRFAYDCLDKYKDKLQKN